MVPQVLASTQLISAFGTPGPREYSVISAFGAPGTREYLVISAFGTPGTRAYSVISAFGTPGTREYYSSRFSGWYSRYSRVLQSFQRLVLQVLVRTVISAFGTTGTREHSVISAVRTPGAREY